MADQIEAGEVAVCTPFLLEAGYSARSAADHAGMLERLMALPWVRVTPDIEDSALRAQAELARVGHHRVAPSDLVIAACASSVGAAVLHYDRDFDVIANARACTPAASGWRRAEPVAAAQAGCSRAGSCARCAAAISP